MQETQRYSFGFFSIFFTYSYTFQDKGWRLFFFSCHLPTLGRLPHWSSPKSEETTDVSESVVENVKKLNLIMNFYLWKNKRSCLFDLWL